MIAAVAALVPGTVPQPASGQAAGEPAPVVRIPIPRDDGSLTPYSFQLGYPLLALVYDTLLWRDPSGVAQPWLATSLDTNPEVNRFTLRLNPAARWHDGAPLTAEDVRFTFRYVAENPHPRFTAEVAEVANVTAPDPATVIITTRRPAPGFADQTLADLPILPAHLWRSLRPGETTPPGLPVGSGPYRLVERTPGGGYRFEANRGYFKGEPRAAQIVVPILSDLGSTLGSFRRGSVHMVPLRLPPEDVRSVEGLGARVSRGPSYWGVQLVFNMRRAPFNDPARRQAVARAMDLERLANTVGDAVPARHGMIHPDSPWAPTDLLQATDEAAARTALAGLTSVEVLSADNDPVHIDAAREVASTLERLGVRALATTRPVADLNRALGTEGAGPDFTLAVTALSPASSYDPDYLARLFGSGTATTSGYSSSAFDQIARRVATTVDRPARQAATAEELRLLATDLPALPLLFPNGAFAYRPAAYADWRYVRGIGIFDKQSFLAGPPGEQTTASTSSPSTAAPGTPTTIPGATPSERGFPIGLVPLGLGCAGLAFMALALLRGRN